MATVKKQIRPENGLVAPLPSSADKLEFMNSTYPIGNGFSKKKTLIIYVHDHPIEGEAPFVL